MRKYFFRIRGFVVMTYGSGSVSQLITDQAGSGSHLDIFVTKCTKHRIAGSGPQHCMAQSNKTNRTLVSTFFTHSPVDFHWAENEKESWHRAWPTDGARAAHCQWARQRTCRCAPGTTRRRGPRGRLSWGWPLPAGWKRLLSQLEPSQRSSLAVDGKSPWWTNDHLLLCPNNETKTGLQSNVGVECVDAIVHVHFLLVHKKFSLIFP